MAITLRSVKGGALSHVEMDENFTDLRDGVSTQIPKTKGIGIKVDSLGTPTFGWRDLNTSLWFDPDALDKPSFETYIGTIKQYAFTVDDLMYFNFHLPHDYVPGTNILIHSHWSHNSDLVTGGGVTWGFNVTHAKGHNQAAFATTKNITVYQAADLNQYQHMVAEDFASISGGSANLLDTDDLEPDGMIFGSVYLAANTLTVSGGGVPEPFLHQIDIHYQSTNMATKQKSPDFWT